MYVLDMEYSKEEIYDTLKTSSKYSCSEETIDRILEKLDNFLVEYTEEELLDYLNEINM